MRAIFNNVLQFSIQETGGGAARLKDKKAAHPGKLRNAPSSQD
jgi:hypothetical protein